MEKKPRENSAPSIENRLENESDDNLSLEWDGEYDKNSPPKENEDDEDLEFEGICRHRRPHRNLSVCVNLFERSESEGSEKQNQVRQKSRAIVGRHSLGDEPSRLVRLETNGTSVDTIQEVVGESSHNSEADVFETEVLPETVNMSGDEQEFQYLEEDYNRRKIHMDDAIKDVRENISSFTVEDVFEFTATEAKDQLNPTRDSYYTLKDDIRHFCQEFDVVAHPDWKKYWNDEIENVFKEIKTNERQVLAKVQEITNKVKERDRLSADKEKN